MNSCPVYIWEFYIMNEKWHEWSFILSVMFACSVSNRIKFIFTTLILFLKKGAVLYKNCVCYLSHIPSQIRPRLCSKGYTVGGMWKFSNSVSVTFSRIVAILMETRRKRRFLVNHAHQWIQLASPIIFIDSFKRFCFSLTSSYKKKENIWLSTI